jgi:LmbE family N-acetylglucosaminyl deacetylase
VAPLGSTSEREGKTIGTLVIVGAHALDAELMGGGAALCMKKKGWETWMLHITRGERGNPEKPPIEYGKQLEHEMKLCAECLGAQCHWMGYIAGELPDEERIIADLCTFFRQTRADVVLTHWKGSYHPRHRLTHDTVFQAVLKMSDVAYLPQVPPCPVATLVYGENMEDEEGFVPGLYLDTTEVHDQWFRALASYEFFTNDNVNKYPYQQFYEANSKLRGIEVGVARAKALMLQPALTDTLHFPGVTPREPVF